MTKRKKKNENNFRSEPTIYGSSESPTLFTFINGRKKNLSKKSAEKLRRKIGLKAPIKRGSKKKSRVTTARKNPSHKTRTPSYNPKAVDDAIASSNRAGRHIGGKERKLIHSLLQGRSAKTTVTVKKNPIPHYIIRAKVKNRDTSFYYDGSRLVASKPQAKKFSDLRDAKHWGEKVWQSFPAIVSVGVLKA